MSSPGIGPGPRPSRGRVRIRHTPRTMFSCSTSPRIRTPSCRFEVCRARPSHSRSAQVARPGIEPGPRASEALVRSGTLTGQMFQYLDLESNQDLNFRTVGHRRAAVVYGPLHYRDMEPTAGFAPASIGLQNRCLTVWPRRQARARGFEPRPPVLEAGCSPRSTLVLINGRAAQRKVRRRDVRDGQQLARVRGIVNRVGMVEFLRP